MAQTIGGQAVRVVGLDRRQIREHLRVAERVGDRVARVGATCDRGDETLFEAIKGYLTLQGRRDRKSSTPAL